MVNFRMVDFEIYPESKNWKICDHAEIDHFGARLGREALGPGRPWDPGPAPQSRVPGPARPQGQYISAWTHFVLLFFQFVFRSMSKSTMQKLTILRPSISDILHDIT